MARYRVDNAYLSEEEYSDFLSRRRSKYIIVIGTIISCVLCHYFILSTRFALSLSHSMKFTILALTFFVSSTFLYFMRHLLSSLISLIFSLLVIVAVAYAVVMIIWKLAEETIHFKRYYSPSFLCFVWRRFSHFSNVCDSTFCDDAVSAGEYEFGIGLILFERP